MATIGILQERGSQRREVLARQLQDALTSRVVIEQAKGVIAERLGLHVDEAFDLMREHARSQNEKLSDVARRVVVARARPGRAATYEVASRVDPARLGRRSRERQDMVHSS